MPCVLRIVTSLALSRPQPDFPVRNVGRTSIMQMLERSKEEAQQSDRDHRHGTFQPAETSKSELGVVVAADAPAREFAALSVSLASASQLASVGVHAASASEPTLASKDSSVGALPSSASELAKPAEVAAAHHATTSKPMPAASAKVQRGKMPLQERAFGPND